MKKRKENQRTRNAMVTQPIRYKGDAYYITLKKLEWELIDTLADYFGESKAGFIARLVDVTEFHKHQPTLKHLDDDSIPNIRDVLKEISAVYKSETSSSSNEAYAVLNSFLVEKKDEIKTNNKFLDTLKPVVKGKMFFGDSVVETVRDKNKMATVSIYFRSYFFEESKDPLIWMINLCNECRIPHTLTGSIPRIWTT